MKIKVKATFTYFVEAASCEEAFNPACDAIGAICFGWYRGEGETTVLSDGEWEKELKALLKRRGGSDVKGKKKRSKT